MLASGELKAKKIAIRNEADVIIQKLYFVFEDGRKIRLKAYDDEKETGSYEANVDGEYIVISGYNNFDGMDDFYLGDAKEIVYKFK